MSCNITPPTNYIPLSIEQIAASLGLSLYDAVHTKLAFEIAFGEPSQRARIFEMMDEQDRQAREKGEPDGLKVRYAVDMDREGFRVMRRADALEPGETALAEGKAEVFCRIQGNFATDDWLGPLVLRRRRPAAEPDISDAVDEIDDEPSLADTVRYCVENDLPIILTEEDAVELLGPEGEWLLRLADGHAVSELSTAGPGNDIDRRQLASAARPRMARHHSGGSFPSLGGGSSSGVSPPAAVGDSRHSGRESCPSPSTP